MPIPEMDMWPRVPLPSDVAEVMTRWVIDPAACGEVTVHFKGGVVMAVTEKHVTRVYQPGREISK